MSTNEALRRSMILPIRDISTLYHIILVRTVNVPTPRAITARR